VEFQLNAVDDVVIVVVCVRVAAKTEMTLVASVRSFSSLQDRCRAVVARHLANASRTGVDSLPLPAPLRKYIADVVAAAAAPGSQSRLHCPPPPRRRVNVALKFWPPSDVNYWPRSGWFDDCLRT